MQLLDLGDNGQALFQQKGILTFGLNFGKCRPIFKILFSEPFLSNDQKLSVCF